MKDKYNSINYKIIIICSHEHLLCSNTFTPTNLEIVKPIKNTIYIVECPVCKKRYSLMITDLENQNSKNFSNPNKEEISQIISDMACAIEEDE